MATISWITGAELENPNLPEADLAAEVASFILYKLSGEKYTGTQTTTEWYGKDQANCWACFPESGSALRSWQFAQAAGLLNHRHRELASSNYTQRITLKNHPVQTILEVHDANGLVDPGKYSLANRTVLRKNTGVWNLYTGVTVTYNFGANPPPLGRVAARSLGNQLLYLLTDPDSCDLPDRVQSVSRQGLSFQLLDHSELAAMGRTGIWEIDMFLNVVNPNHAQKRPRVFTPDKPRGDSFR